jgi:hypothetical protein
LASPWTTYVPATDPKTFITQIRDQSFPYPDSPQDSQPRVNGRAVYVDIYPEGTAASKFDPGNPGQPPFGETNFKSYAGRILAKFRLRDIDSDYPVLGLYLATAPHLCPTATNPNKSCNIYAIWWVETSKSSDWNKWTSHFFRVNEDSSTVVELHGDTTQTYGYITQQFLFVPEKGHAATPNAPSLADFNKHDIALGTLLHSASLPIAQTRRFNSSWISCGSGCCNGQ